MPVTMTLISRLDPTAASNPARDENAKRDLAADRAARVPNVVEMAESPLVKCQRRIMDLEKSVFLQEADLRSMAGRIARLENKI